MLMSIFSITVVLGWTYSVSALPIASILEMKAIASGVTDHDIDQQDATINPLNVSVIALATGESGNVLVTGEGSATWVNPNQGLVIFDNVGYEIEVVYGLSGTVDLRFAQGWKYQFVADATGLFTLEYDITGFGSNTGYLHGFEFNWHGGPGGNYDHFKYCLVPR